VNAIFYQSALNKNLSWISDRQLSAYIFHIHIHGNRNEYQEHFLGVKASGVWGLQPYHHRVPLSWNLGTLISRNPLGHSGTVTALIYLFTHGHLHTVTYTRGRIDTIDSPDDEHLVSRNMYRIGINRYKVKNCASRCLFTRIIYKEHKEDHA
jgi:hypothetical protein